MLVFVFPALYGEGYSMMGEVLAGNYSGLTDYGPFAHCGKEMLPVLLLGIVAVKSFAATASNSGGGVAGDFAPTLMAGCMLGLMYALGAQYWLGIDLETGNLAYYGMAGAHGRNNPGADYGHIHSIGDEWRIHFTASYIRCGHNIVSDG